MDNSSIVALYFARSERAIQETDHSRLYPRFTLVSPQGSSPSGYTRYTIIGRRNMGHD